MDMIYLARRSGEYDEANLRALFVLRDAADDSHRVVR